MTEAQTQTGTDPKRPISNVPEEPAEVDISTLKAMEMQSKIVMLNPDEIVVSDGMNMRRYPPNAAYIDELARDIVTKGQLQPVLVREITTGTLKGKSMLVFGFCRLRAISYANEKKLAKGLKVAAIVATNSMSDLEGMASNVSENLKRQDLSHIDHAFICQTFLDSGVTKSGIARMLKRVPSWVTEHLALVELPATIQKKIHTGTIPYTAVREMAEMDEGERDKFIESLEKGTTTRENARKKKTKKRVQEGGRAPLTWKEA
ncbi:MAG: ParB/RepB/Spo0J family partition protein, partial [Thaumarchaeota archaeon]|nr:ParB/RepB/Spo0J family partition protein [Nitrososphaerota archaeon]